MTEKQSGLPIEARPAAASVLFGDRLELAGRYADRLVSDGVTRGIIGPAEAHRIWGRHLLNCAALVELIPSGALVVDIGSGGGLPGIVVAVARPDLQVILVESLARRTAFLSETIEQLGLTGVRVLRARAEECVNELPAADVVTARAVASLDRLAAWGLPLLTLGGRLLAIKGVTAEREVSDHRSAVRRLGGGDPVIRKCGTAVLTSPVTVVEVVRERLGVNQPSAKRGRHSVRR